jgi:hypothetical protein
MLKLLLYEGQSAGNYIIINKFFNTSSRYWIISSFKKIFWFIYLLLNQIILIVKIIK